MPSVWQPTHRESPHNVTQIPSYLLLRKHVSHTCPRPGGLSAKNDTRTCNLRCSESQSFAEDHFNSFSNAGGFLLRVQLSSWRGGYSLLAPPQPNDLGCVPVAGLPARTFLQDKVDRMTNRCSQGTTELEGQWALQGGGLRGAAPGQARYRSYCGVRAQAEPCPGFISSTHRCPERWGRLHRASVTG